MSELAGGGVATVTSSFAPILAERSTLHASAFLLPFAFALTTAAAFPASQGSHLASGTIPERPCELLLLSLCRWDLQRGGLSHHNGNSCGFLGQVECARP